MIDLEQVQTGTIAGSRPPVSVVSRQISPASAPSPQHANNLLGLLHQRLCYRSAMAEPRVIKKYPNRRLYDTAESRYITLADIRKLVVDRIDFVVLDKTTQEDITRSILLQVIAEQESCVSEPVMSRDFLSQIIRSYGGNMQNVVGSYLEQSLKLFDAQQREVREQSA